MSDPAFAPALSDADVERAAQHYAEFGYVRLENVLSQGDAEALYTYLEQDAEWWRVFNQGERAWDLGPESIEMLETDAQGEQLQQAILAGARDGFQFHYDTVRVSENPAERSARNQLADRLLDALNGEEWLAIMRQVTGRAEADFVDGQATRYLPGHFLTGHDDNVDGKNRIAAYVLGLTPHWRTEWGGLLQFHEADGDVERGLAPKFNVINMFAVPRLHSVSPVSAFAGAPRYSFTGWVRHASR